MLASVIIRTYNEEKHLPELLEAIQNQQRALVEIEIIIVDSGSSDNTLKIAKQFNCRITHIKKEEFTFGRSLNLGCEFANGEFLVFISGHCIPVKNDWIQQLLKPLIDNRAVYSYGQQIGRDTTKFSEEQVFKKFYSSKSKIPQTGYFCNNANAALLKSAWFEQAFDEKLTGLEDMFFAKQLVEKGKQIAYVAEAPVYHIHDETWHQVKVRYEREAIALQHIMPNVHFTLKDLIYCFMSSIFLDFSIAAKEKNFFHKIYEIVMFRLMQYWGTHKGNNEHRQLSIRMKEEYFYPKS